MLDRESLDVTYGRIALRSYRSEKNIQGGGVVYGWNALLQRRDVSGPCPPEIKAGAVRKAHVTRIELWRITGAFASKSFVP